MERRKISVRFFQRRPRKGFSFSLEYIFNDVRERLADKIEASIAICRFYNDGYFTKIYNILEAGFRQSQGINHITGEVHFLDLLMIKKKVVLTIHDCGMLRRKTGMAKRIVQWLYLSAPVSKAYFVTAVSEETKKEIISYTKCNPDKIKVIPVAVSSAYIPFPKKFNYEKPIILHIGTSYNKNLLRLIQALEGINCHLTIVGKLSNEQSEALLFHKVYFSNEYNISDNRMLQKYKECDIVSFVSTSEGFGMPIVEANAVERVVLTSDISSMPEIAEHAACLVNPYDIDDIRNGILKIINNKDYRDNLIMNGRINKLRFDGEKIADAYYNLYSDILNNRNNLQKHT